METQNPYLRQMHLFLSLMREINDVCFDQYSVKIAPSPGKRNKEREERIEKLKRLGVKPSGDGLSFYTNQLPLACKYCQAGKNLTVMPSLRCNRDCFYCFADHPRDQKDCGKAQIRSILDTIKRSTFQNNILNLGISGGEPILVLDKVLEIIKAAKQRAGIKSFIHLYTNGDLLDDKILRKLKEVGLDEIRFGVKFGDFNVLDKIALAKKHIPRVMMEGPVFPEGKEYMKELLLELNKIKISAVVFLELYFRKNPEIFKRRGYMLNYKDKLPFYDIWENHGWPVYGCEETIFDLLEFALRKKLTLPLHYCSLRSMRLRTMLRRMEASSQNKRDHEVITEKGLLKKLVVYTPDHIKARAGLKKGRVPEQRIVYSPDKKRLETHPDNLRFLDPSKYDIGILCTLPTGEAVGLDLIKSKRCLARRKNDLDRYAQEASLYFASWGDRISDIFVQKRIRTNNKSTRVMNIFKKYLNLLPDNPAIYLALSKVCYDLGKQREAGKAINKLAELGLT